MTEIIFTGPDNITSIEQMNSITSFVIPDGYTKIEDYAFKAYSKLERVYIPNSITKIGNNAFMFCFKLKKLIIPNSVKEIGNNAFIWSGLQSINIPDSVTTFGEKLFVGCYGLSKVNIIASTVESFKRIENIIKSQEIANTVVFNDLDTVKKIELVDTTMLSIHKSEESKIKKEDEERPAKRIKTEDKSKIDSTKLDDINIFQNVFSFLGISSDKKETDGRKSKKKRKSKTKSRKKRKSKSKY